MARSGSISGRVIARLRNYFLAGVLVTAPLGITVAFVWWLVHYVDEVVVPLIPDSYNPVILLRGWLGLEGNIPGLGLLAVLVVITLIGAVTAGLLGRWLVAASESVLNRMPLVRNLYGAERLLAGRLSKAEVEARLYGGQEDANGEHDEKP